ncbi:hypothetical protein [Humibacter ginsenosidimutans]|uniref:Transcriptional regulator, AbiEi antitoxin, Type IV TA system n=1 Tax=Humibacter ginsenosidimutans TaxID=2599293 RepID=A0A5B8M3N2_9MICO|nr:hypothetical protein [Humibacter ginsenosidimutans]QDZ14896.1 hypothetical protein FPZ11_09100 [Humibacter ginsenosidimutans]
MTDAQRTEPEQALVLARDLRALGRYDSQRAVRGAHELTSLRWGAYATASDLAHLKPAETYMLQVLAAAAMRKAPVVTGVSAGVLCGLPLVGWNPPMVFLMGTGTSGRRRNGVVEVPRWRSATVLDGTPSMTALPDTLIEVCRTAPFLTALNMVDQALLIDRFGSRPPMTTPAELADAFQRRMPFRGSARVRTVLDFSDTHAESVFETLSRTTIAEEGFPTPVTQIEVILPDGTAVYSDFGWPEYRVLGEADGWGKYVNPRYPSAGSLEERVRAEKARDNALRRVEWMPAHWEWNDAWNRSPLTACLQDAGLPIVRRRMRLR